MPRPNILFLFTDEQRADTLAAYGNDRENWHAAPSSPGSANP